MPIKLSRRHPLRNGGEHGTRPKLRLCLVGVPLLFLLSGTDCVNMPPECEEYYALRPGQQEAEFRTYPIEKQLIIYRCGMERVHPPDITLARVIAKSGERNIPELVERLKHEKSEVRQEHILYIFQLMSQEGHLNGRRDVIDELRRVVYAMRNRDIRPRAEEKLAEIENNSSL